MNDILIETVATIVPYIWYEIWSIGGMFYAALVDVEMGTNRWIARDNDESTVYATVRNNMRGAGL